MTLSHLEEMRAARRTGRLTSIVREAMVKDAGPAAGNALRRAECLPELERFADAGLALLETISALDGGAATAIDLSVAAANFAVVRMALDARVAVVVRDTLGIATH